MFLRQGNMERMFDVATEKAPRRRWKRDALATMVRLSRIAAFIWYPFVLALSAISPASGQADSGSKDSAPSQAAFVSRYCLATHDVGRLVFGITNFGRVGIGRDRTVVADCFTGVRSPLGVYPKGSNTTYLYKGALWVGAVVGRDTLVSTGNEFNNESREMHPIADIVRRSTLDLESPGSSQAVSEQDYVAVYADIFRSGVAFPSFDPLEVRSHKPIGIQVTQRSYAWSYSHTDDFVIIEFELQNVTNNILRDVYVGLYLDADVHIGQTNVNISPDPYGRKGMTGGRDDISGFLYAVPTVDGACTFRDTIALAWTADNNGDARSADDFDVPHVIGIRFLNSGLLNRRLSYNWWVYNYNSLYDFGPQHRKNYRIMGNGLGTPYGDRRKYTLLSNGEIDYDQAYTGTIGEFDPVWMGPNRRVAYLVSKGSDVQQLISVGPLVMVPGGSVTIPVAFVAGEWLHTDYTNYGANLSGHYEPDIFYENLDFSSLIANAITAERVYDIPGVDTDGDGYGGEYRVCEAETTYYKGDGFADLIASEPPPPPVFRLTPTLRGIRVRFNGTYSETTPDIFSGKVDFEGYRVYVARDERETSYSLVAQYDRENYDKYVYTTRKGVNPSYKRLDDPFTLEELRCLYGRAPDPCADTSFDPFGYSPDNPYVHPQFPDSIFYFESHDYNQSVYGVSTPMRKVYPDAPYPPSLEVDEVPQEHLTEEGYLRYFEYQCDIEDLLPSVPYFIAVTAFDIGSPETGLEPLESSKVLTAQSVYPNNSFDEKPDKIGNVYVFPNPYRDDAGYRKQGYEGRGQEIRSRDRVRKVTFANLPPRCTIRIYSLDGDLIREIKHDFHPSDPNSSYHEWDLVTRNIQMIVSGLYYWTVEDESGNTQIGKLAVLM
jgi:hypothetical protein